MIIKQKILPYIMLCIVFLINFTAFLAIATENCLTERSEITESSDSSLSRDFQGGLLEGNNERKSQQVNQQILVDESSPRGSLKSRSPPWVPSAEYFEDYVDTMIDAHAPADVGSIDDWSQMQAKDDNYSNLTEFIVVDITNWHNASAYENSNGWQNPQRMYVSNDERARAFGTDKTVNIINFTFPDLSGRKIAGIEVEVEGYRQTGSSGGIDVSLLWDGRSQETSAKTVILPPSSDAYILVGGTADTWGRTWDSSDFTNSNFGIKLNSQVVGFYVYVDYIRIRIHLVPFQHEFNREFLFTDVAVYDEDLELSIRTGQISNETLRIEMWNTTTSNWAPLLNITDSDDYTWKNVSLNFSLTNTNLYFRFVDNKTLNDPYTNTWQIDVLLIRYRLAARHFLNRKNIVIDHTQVSDSLRTFPVLVDLYDTDLHDDTQFNGDDVIFTNSTGVKLAHEIESFNQTFSATHARLIAWVNVPNVSNTVDTVISMYYGNNSITNQENPWGTWASFLGVWHLKENVTDEGFVIDAHNDSTIKANHGNQDGNEDISSLIGTGQDFDGTDDVINITADNNLNPDDNVTISGWFKLDTAHSSSSTTSQLIMAKYNNTDNNMHILLAGTDYSTGEAVAGALVFKVENNGNFMYKWTNRITWAADTWYYFACTLNTTNPENNAIFINGLDDTNTTSFGTLSSANFTYSAHWGIGGRTVDIEIPSGQAWFDGELDEVKVATTIRSAPWILMEYNNQRDPNSLYSLGLEEHMTDLDPPTVVDFGVIDPGDGHPEFWANITDDFSGVATVTLKLNSTEHPMTLNTTSGYWVYQPLGINYSDYFTYQINNASDNIGQYITTSSAVKNVTFDYDTVAPSVDEWEYFPEISFNGTFNANVSDWGIIDVVIVNVTEVGSNPTSITAVMRSTASGYINDTIKLERGSIIQFVITVNDTSGNNITSMPHTGYVGLNNAPIATNLALLPDPVRSNEMLQLIYDFDDPDEDPETGTEIRWYKNGIPQPEHNDTTTISADHLFKNDQWNATVRPKDWKDFGDLVASDIVLIQNSMPVVSDVRFIHENVDIRPIDNDRNFVLEYEPLIINYTFFDADLTDSDESTVYWYLNDTRKSQYTNWRTIAANYTSPGDVWQAEIVPHDGEEASPSIWSKKMTVESYPDFWSYGIEPWQTREGMYTLWINVTDVRNSIHEVELLIAIEENNDFLGRFVIGAVSGTGFWRLERLDLLEGSEPEFVNLLGLTLNVTATIITQVTYGTTTFDIQRVVTFSFAIEDHTPPRVADVWSEWGDEFYPTNITFWAVIEEYGLGIEEVLLYYEYRPVTGNTGTKWAGNNFSTPMTFNGTHWVATVSFTPDQSYDIVYGISVLDRAGNSNANAWPLGNSEPLRFNYASPPPWELIIIVIVVIIAIIGLIAVVAIRTFRKTELIGMDINQVIENINEVNDYEIEAALDGHTLGIVICFFDQEHGPIPIVIEPSILEDNFNKLIQLADLSFSACRFVDNFEEELPANFEFTLAPGIRTTSIAFAFALQRSKARGGSENITLNILVHKNYVDLVIQFVKQFSDLIHEIHVLMNKSPNEKEIVKEKVIKLRKEITSMILSYENLYGQFEPVEED